MPKISAPLASHIVFGGSDIRKHTLHTQQLLKKKVCLTHQSDGRFCGTWHAREDHCVAVAGSLPDRTDQLLAASNLQVNEDAVNLVPSNVIARGIERRNEPEAGSELLQAL